MKICLHKFLRLLPILFFVILINYFGDPAHLYSHGQYEEGIAQLLLKSHNVANISNYNEIALQKFYISGLNKKNDTIVLGSSRGMQLRANLFPWERFFNHSVSGASLEDFLALYQMYREKGFSPSMVVLVMDPWMILRGRPRRYSYWIIDQKNYKKIAKRAGLPIKTRENAYLTVQGYFYLSYQLISPSYFQAAVSKILSKWRGNVNSSYYITNDSEADTAIKLKDGSLSYDKPYRTASRAVEKIGAIQNVQEYLSKETPIDEFAKKEFANFIQVLQYDGVSVCLILPPFHPFFYDALLKSQNRKNYDQAEEFFKAFGAAHRIQVLGSFNPHSVGFNEEDFYDGVHPKTSAIFKLLQGIQLK